MSTIISASAPNSPASSTSATPLITFTPADSTTSLLTQPQLRQLVEAVVQHLSDHPELLMEAEEDTMWCCSGLWAALVRAWG